MKIRSLYFSVHNNSYHVPGVSMFLHSQPWLICVLCKQGAGTGRERWALSSLANGLSPFLFVSLGQTLLSTSIYRLQNAYLKQCNTRKHFQISLFVGEEIASLIQIMSLSNTQFHHRKLHLSSELSIGLTWFPIICETVLRAIFIYRNQCVINMPQGGEGSLSFSPLSVI